MLVDIPIPSTEAFIVDEKGNWIQNGEIGEQVIRGNIVMHSYWKSLELTRKVFRAGDRVNFAAGRFVSAGPGGLITGDKKKNVFNYVILILLINLCAIGFQPNYAEAKNLGNIGTFVKWGKVEIILTGPDSSGAGEPNPFAMIVDVTFTGPSGQKYVVPGFYAGDGAYG